MRLFFTAAALAVGVKYVINSYANHAFENQDWGCSPESIAQLKQEIASSKSKMAFLQEKLVSFQEGHVHPDLEERFNVFDGLMLEMINLKDRLNALNIKDFLIKIKAMSSLTNEEFMQMFKISREGICDSKVEDITPETIKLVSQNLDNILLALDEAKKASNLYDAIYSFTNSLRQKCMSHSSNVTESDSNNTNYNSRENVTILPQQRNLFKM